MRTIFEFFLVIVAVLSLSACASISRFDFAGDARHPDLRTAALNSKPIGQVEYGSARNIKIGTNSPLMVADSLNGRFEIVSIQGVKGRPYSITVAALCDCLGFRKWSVVPEAYLLDHLGNTVAQGARTAPTSRYITGTFPEDGEYKVLVLADATSEGARVGEIQGWVPGPAAVAGFLSISMQSHPTGIVQVNHQKETP
jgi:hypothetical protein